MATQGYAICSNPRSGSTFLIRLLKSTGQLGVPNEWLRGDGGRASLMYDEYPTDVESQVQFMLTDGATPNGVCAVKMFPEHFDTREDSRWAERLPNARFVYLRRLDVLGQAISLSLARQTNSYGHWAPHERLPVYDRDHIRNCLDFIIEGEARWRLYFAINSIEPLEIDYEELTADPQGIVDRIANFVGVAEAAIDWTASHTQKQADALNEEWRSRFIAESADLGILPRLIGAGLGGSQWTAPPSVAAEASPVVCNPTVDIIRPIGPASPVQVLAESTAQAGLD